MNLFVTADDINAETGGGLVCRNELEALRTLGPCEVIGRKELAGLGDEPWKWDERAFSILTTTLWHSPFKLAHFYSGSFPKTVFLLKSKGVKVTYTVAAHDKEVSRAEHEKLGLSFPYLHLTDDTLWRRYIEGYCLADVIICPSQAAIRTIKNYGPDFRGKRIALIPHGCEIPDTPIEPLPGRFAVGYLGAVGPDKGLCYLFEAWKKLAYKDALLVVAGRDSISPFCYSILERFGGGHVCLAGWQKKISDFYNSISLYVQPSATEGFGIEILEAMAHGRPVLCSDAAACECVGKECAFSARNADVLAGKIEWVRGRLENVNNAALWQNSMRHRSMEYTWDKIQQQYCSLWRGLLS